MDDNLSKIFKKWDEFKDTHTKCFLPERRLAVFALYERVHAELVDEAAFTLDDQETSCTITITADSFVTSDDFPALRDMICNANAFRTYIRDEQVVLDMWFTFCDWIPNT